jgi:hypothetical protein
MFEDERVQSAARLFRLVNDVRFTASFSLFAVSKDLEVASKESAIKAVEAIALSRNEEFGTPDCGDEHTKQRCKDIWDEATVLPNLNKTNLSDVRLGKLGKWRVKKVADAMRLAGCAIEETKTSGALYRSIHRYIAGAGELTTKNPARNPVRPPVSIVTINNSDDSSTIAQLSPSSNAFSSISNLTSPSQASLSQTTTSLTTCTISSQASRPSSKSSLSDFERLLALPNTRRTSKQTQDQRKIEKAWKDTHSVAFKIGTVIHDAAVTGSLPLTKFSNAEKVARSVNEFLGCDTITGTCIMLYIRRDKRLSRRPLTIFLLLLQDKIFCTQRGETKLAYRHQDKALPPGSTSATSSKSVNWFSPASPLNKQTAIQIDSTDKTFDQKLVRS